MLFSSSSSSPPPCIPFIYPHTVFVPSLGFLIQIFLLNWSSNHFLHSIFEKLPKTFFHTNNEIIKKISSSATTMAVAMTMTTTTTITKSKREERRKKTQKNHYYCMTKVTKTDTIRCIASENRRCRNSFIQTHNFVCLCSIFYSVFYGDRSCLFHSLHLCSIVVLYTHPALAHLVLSLSFRFPRFSIVVRRYCYII